MSEIDDFFKQNVSESQGVPAYYFETLGDQVGGEILEVKPGVVTDIGTTEPKLDKNGKTQPQLAITVQTSLRNWEHVKTPPTDENNQPRPGADDDGRRRIYVKYASGVAALYAVLKAANATPADLREGAMFGAQFSETRPTAKGQQKVFTYFFKKGAAPAVAGVFDQANEQQAAAQPQVQTAPAPADPFASSSSSAPAPAQETFAAPAAAPTTDEPPF